MTEYSVNIRFLQNEKQSFLGAHPNEMFYARLWFKVCGKHKKYPK